MSEKIVVIGGVAAGPKTACRVKRLMPESEITIIDSDSLISYGGCGFTSLLKMIYLQLVILPATP